MARGHGVKDPRVKLFRTITLMLISETEKILLYLHVTIIVTMTIVEKVLMKIWFLKEEHKTGCCTVFTLNDFQFPLSNLVKTLLSTLCCFTSY